MDSQSVCWGDNRPLNGIDGNKRVKRIKRHVVDKNGFLLTVMVTIVCVHDGKVVYLLARLSWGTLLYIKIILADVGYRWGIGENIKNAFEYLAILGMINFLQLAKPSYYRNSKQVTGFADCQSRDLDKLHFHLWYFIDQCKYSLIKPNIAINRRLWEEGIGIEVVVM